MSTRGSFRMIFINSGLVPEEKRFNETVDNRGIRIILDESEREPE